MLYGLLLSLNVLVCAGLVLVVLLQRSEGGALGTGGGPAGMVSARGAGDLLTRTTWILFTLFLGLSLSLTLIGAHDRNEKVLLERMKLGPGAPVASGASAATPAAPSAPLAPLAPVGGLNPSSLPPPVAAPVAPPTPMPAARQEPPKPQARKPDAAKPEALRPQATTAEAPKPAPPKPAKAHSAASSPAASATSAGPAAASAPVITPPPPKADSDAGKTSAP